MSELAERASSLTERLAELEAFFDVAQLEAEASRLTEEMSRPGFWDDTDIARDVSSRFSRVEGRLRLLEELRARLADSGELLELAEDDADLLPEVEE